MFKIVLCPKSFAGKELTYYLDFLKYYLFRKSQRAVVANEVWNNWKFILLSEHGDDAESSIAHTRAFVRPESTILDEEKEEGEPTKHTEKELLQKTKSLVNRFWVDID